MFLLITATCNAVHPKGCRLFTSKSFVFNKLIEKKMIKKFILKNINYQSLPF